MLKRFGLIVLFWFGVALWGAAQSLQLPLWEMDLRQSPPARPGASLQRPFANAVALAFVNNETVLLAYKPTSKIEEIKAESRPLLDTAGVLIDIPSGKIRSTRGWPTESPAIFGTAAGNLLVSTGKQLLLETPRDSKLETLACASADKISPNDRTIALYRYRFPPNPPDVMFLDSDTLTDTGKRFSGFVSGISNDHIAWKTDKGPVLIQGPEGTREICRTDCGDYPVFLDDHRLLITSGNHFAVLDLAGKVLYRDQFASQTAHGWVRVEFAGVARDGSRFSVTSSTLEMADPPITVKQSVFVYDVASGKRVFALESPQQEPIFDLWAISPDGSLLANATWFDGIVRLYKITPQPLPGAESLTGKHSPREE